MFTDKCLCTIPCLSQDISLFERMEVVVSLARWRVYLLEPPLDVEDTLGAGAESVEGAHGEVNVAGLARGLHETSAVRNRIEHRKWMEWLTQVSAALAVMEVPPLWMWTERPQLALGLAE